MWVVGKIPDAIEGLMWHIMSRVMPQYISWHCKSGDKVRGETGVSLLSSQVAHLCRERLDDVSQPDIIRKLLADLPVTQLLSQGSALLIAEALYGDGAGNSC